jgi:hypothetical protein
MAGDARLYGVFERQWVQYPHRDAPEWRWRRIAGPFDDYAMTLDRARELRQELETPLRVQRLRVIYHLHVGAATERSAGDGA